MTDKNNPKKPLPISKTGRQKGGLFAAGNQIGAEAARRSPRSHYRRAAQQFCEKNSQEVLDTIMQLVREKNWDALKFMAQAVIAPIRPTTYVDQSLIQDVITQQDANNAMTGILNEISTAEMSIEEGDQLISIIQKKIESTQLCMQEQLNEIQNKLIGLSSGK